MTQKERAVQIWPLLVWVAKSQQLITYGDIAKMTGMLAVGVGPQPLKVIKNYCERKDYPPLTAVVVNDKTGVPGHGLGLSPEASCKALRKVFKYPYIKKGAPNKEDFL